MINLNIPTLATLVITSLMSLNVSAHSGGTNSAGCHNDHSNGTYHCHRSEEKIKGRTLSSVVGSGQENLLIKDLPKSSKMKKFKKVE